METKPIAFAHRGFANEEGVKEKRLPLRSR